MPVTTAIEGRILHTVFSDPFTLDDFLHASLAAMQSPAFTPPMSSLIDVSRVTRSVPAEEIDAMAEFSSHHKHKFSPRAAIVCEPGSLVFGLSRMYCSMAECYNLEYTLFSNLDEARLWISQETSKISV
jgi:hypothetical protein